MPAVPSMVISMPFLTTWPLTSNSSAFRSILISSAPQMQGLPMALVTMAACEVSPPLEVSTPSAAAMPWISSGLVSGRTRMTFSLFSANLIASVG